MENRFGVKDFALFGLMFVLIGVVLLAMVQYDHQNAKLIDLANAQNRQAADIGKIEATLKGWPVPTAGGPAASAGGPVASAGGPVASAGGPAATASAVPTTTAASNLPPSTAPTDAASDPFARMRAAQAMPGYAMGDTLVASGPNANKLTPLLNTDALAGTIHDFVLQSLVTRDPVTLAWQPLLATPGWTVTDNSAAYFAYTNAHPTTASVDPENPPPADPNAPSPVSVTFHVRPNATFSDGQPVTADDVVWTYDWIMNPQVAAVRQRSGMRKIRRVFKTGDGGVTFEFAEPYFDYIGLAGGMAVLPKHHYGSYDPKAYNLIPCDLLGSGPFQLKDPTGWHPGEEIVLVRNEKYWGPKPALASVRYRIIVPDQVRMTAFTNRELDRLGTTPPQYDSLLKNEQVMAHTQHFAYDTVNAGYRFVAWNQRRAEKPTPFADRRVRQAMTMLLNRQRIVDEFLRGYGTVPTGPFNRLGKQCDPAIRPWPFDVARAKALLAEVGYADDGAGSLKRDGQPLAFKLTYPSGSPLVDKIVLFMRDTMAQAGVTLDPDPQDWSVFQDRLKQHDFDAIMLGWTAGIEDDIYQMFDSSQIAAGGEDFMSYRNPELDRLIEQARQTIDEAKRIALWRQCHAILHEDQPYTFMSVSKTLLFLDNRFKGVEQVPLGLNDLSEWFVPSGLQKYTN